MPTTYHCRRDIQMRFKDVDMFGHVNNTVYLEYMDYGKTQYIQEVLGDIFDIHNDAMVIANINVDFFSPTRYDEPVAVLTCVKSIGERSMTFKQQVINSETGEVKCKAKIIMVGYNAKTSETMIIPDAWRERIYAYEGKEPKK